MNDETNVNHHKVNDAYQRNRALVRDAEEGTQAAEKTNLKKATKELLKQSKEFEKSKAKTYGLVTKISLGTLAAVTLIAVAEAIAIAAMMPLKEKIPQWYEWDASRGTFTPAKRLDQNGLKWNQATDLSQLDKYVVARESYDWNLANDNYLTVQSMSDVNSALWKEYDSAVKAENSPLNILKDKARVKLEVISRDVDTEQQVATWRFKKSVIASDGHLAVNIPPTYWIATISYSYPNPELDEAQRLKNPPGMIVNAYRPAQELGQ
jgi:type IV secretion system protein VirB8